MKLLRLYALHVFLSLPAHLFATQPCRYTMITGSRASSPRRAGAAAAGTAPLPPSDTLSIACAALYSRVSHRLLLRNASAACARTIARVPRSAVCPRCAARGRAAAPARLGVQPVRQPLRVVALVRLHVRRRPQLVRRGRGRQRQRAPAGARPHERQEVVHAVRHAHHVEAAQHLQGCGGGCGNGAAWDTARVRLRPRAARRRAVRLSRGRALVPRLVPCAAAAAGEGGPSPTCSRCRVTKSRARAPGAFSPFR